jgi:hypothetical protein
VFSRLAVLLAKLRLLRLGLAGVRAQVRAVLAFVEEAQQAGGLFVPGWDQAELGEEDRLYRERGFRGVLRVRDVDPFVGVLLEDACIRRTKGAVTCSR